MKTTTRKWISLALVFIIGVFPSVTFALPSDGQVVSGSGTIGTTAPGHMVINQNTQQMITNWQDFSIGSAESVTFNQPNQQSTSLNRVLGADPSRIMGKLTANGQVFLTNPSGVLFGPGAVVNAHGLVATTLGISDQDFLDRNYNFTQDPTRPLASVINQGHIETSGYTGLLAPAVSNQGTVIANLGSVALSSGEAATLDFIGDGLIQFKLQEKVSGDVTDTEGNVLEDRVHNSGTISANGGQVILSARDAGSVIRNVINNEGVIEAKSVVQKNGRIFLSGGGSGIVSNSGTLDASGKNSGETGGQIVVLGEKVGLFDQAKLDVSGDAGGGEILLGGEQQGATAVEGEENTDVLYIDDHAEINADAITTGNGGRIITWANHTNRAFGQIYARGGALSGNGGFVEISGGRYFEIGQIPDVSAANGEGGHWLIDPTGNDLSIVAGGGNTNINAANPFATTNDAASLGWDLIRAALIAGSAVTVTTTNSGTNSQTGNITVNTDLDYNGIGTGKTLAFTAIGDIIFNNKIFDSSGTDDILNLVLNSGGGITLDADGSVVSGTLIASTLDGSGGFFDVEASTTFTVKGMGSNLNSEITAFDFDFAGTFNFDDTNSLVLIQRSSSTGFGIGASNCSSVCDTLIDNGELNRIVIPNGRLIFTGHSNTFVKDVASASTNQIKDVSFSMNTADLEFEAGTGSTFNNLFISMFNAMNNDVLMNSDVTITSGSFQSLDSANFNVAAGKTLNTTNNLLQIFTDDIDLQGNLNSGTGTTTISTNNNAGNDIELGNVGSPGANLLQLTNAELANITAGTLNISATQDIRADGVNSASFNNIANFLFVTSGQDLIFQNNASSFRFLTASANRQVDVQENVSSTAQDLTLNADFNNDGNGNLDIAGGTTLTSNSVLRLNAGSAMIDAAGALTLNANNSVDLQTNTDLGGNTTINADFDNNGTGNFMVGAGDTVDSSSGNSDIDVTAADVQLDGSVNTGNGTFTILASNNRSYGVGTVAGGLTLDGGELSRISTSGILQIGDATTNTINVNGVTAAQTNNINQVDFLSDQSVNFGASASTFRAVDVFADNGSTVVGNITTTVGDLDIDADADTNNTGVLNIGAGVVLDAADEIFVDGSATGTGIVAAGAVTLRAQNGIAILENMSTNGVTTLNADTATPGDGLLDTFGSLTSNNNNILINADDIDLSGPLNAGTANIFIAVSDSQDLNLGTGGASMNLDDSEMDQITANKLSFFASGDVNVENLTNSSVSQLILNTSKDINFINQDSTVNSIDANAGRDIKFQNSLTATSGEINLKADVDGNGVGDVIFGSGVTVASSGNNINITANDYRNAASFILNAGTGDVSIDVSDGAAIGVGDGSCPNGCGMQISKTELSNIFARDLKIGSISAGNIFVNNVVPVDVANINRNVLMNSGKNITFYGGPSGFKGLELKAITDINILTNVTTTQFDFTAVADVENNAIGQFNMPAGVSVNSAANINVKAVQINADGTFNANGNVNLVETFPATGFNSGTQSTFLTNFLKNAAAGCS